jgi:hypothetical protein
MTSDKILAKYSTSSSARGMAYRALKRRFNLDDNDLHELKAEFIQVPHR